MNHKERLKEFLTYKDIGQNKFADNVGISAGYINNLKDSIGSKIINKISGAYPELNIGWLLTGEGEMLKDISIQNTNPTNEETMTIGMLTKMLFDSQERVKVLEKEISDLKGENSTHKYCVEKKESKAG